MPHKPPRVSRRRRPLRPADPAKLREWAEVYAADGVVTWSLPREHYRMLQILRYTKAMEMGVPVESLSVEDFLKMQMRQEYEALLREVTPEELAVLQADADAVLRIRAEYLELPQGADSSAE